MWCSLTRVGNPCVSGVDRTVSTDTDVFAGFVPPRSARTKCFRRRAAWEMCGQRTVSTLAVKM